MGSASTLRSIEGMPVSKTRPFRSLDINEMLPLLASRYEAGRLAPFIGAGMSRPRLAGWDCFVAKLETMAGITGTDGCPDDHLDARAEKAVAVLRSGNCDGAFWEAISEALKGEEFDQPQIPPQTMALAAIHWPLTISTNYDSLFYSACHQACRTGVAPLLL